MSPKDRSGMSTVLHFLPPGFSSVSYFDVTGVGVFSRMKSASFVSGFGVSFLLFHFSAVTPVTINFDLYPKSFCICTPPVSIRLSTFTVGQSYFFIFGCFIICVSHPDLSHRPYVGSIHLRGML